MDTTSDLSVYSTDRLMLSSHDASNDPRDLRLHLLCSGNTLLDSVSSTQGHIEYSVIIALVAPTTIQVICNSRLVILQLDYKVKDFQLMKFPYKTYLWILLDNCVLCCCLLPINHWAKQYEDEILLIDIKGDNILEHLTVPLTLHMSEKYIAVIDRKPSAVAFYSYVIEPAPTEGIIQKFSVQVLAITSISCPRHSCVNDLDVLASFYAEPSTEPNSLVSSQIVKMSPTFYSRLVRIDLAIAKVPIVICSLACGAVLVVSSLKRVIVLSHQLENVIAFVHDYVSLSLVTLSGIALVFSIDDDNELVLAIRTFPAEIRQVSQSSKSIIARRDKDVLQIKICRKTLEVDFDIVHEGCSHIVAFKKADELIIVGKSGFLITVNPEKITNPAGTSTSFEDDRMAFESTMKVMDRDQKSLTSCFADFAHLSALCHLDENSFSLSIVNIGTSPYASSYISVRLITPSWFPVSFNWQIVIKLTCPDCSTVCSFCCVTGKFSAAKIEIPHDMLQRGDVSVHVGWVYVSLVDANSITRFVKHQLFSVLNFSSSVEAPVPKKPCQISNFLKTLSMRNEEEYDREERAESLKIVIKSDKILDFLEGKSTVYMLTPDGQGITLRNISNASVCLESFSIFHLITIYNQFSQTRSLSISSARNFLHNLESDLEKAIDACSLLGNNDNGMDRLLCHVLSFSEDSEDKKGK